MLDQKNKALPQEHGHEKAEPFPGAPGLVGAPRPMADACDPEAVARALLVYLRRRSATDNVRFQTAPVYNGDTG